MPSVAAASSGPAVSGLLPTAVQYGSVNASGGQLVQCDATTGAITVTLPATTTVGLTIGVKKVDASTNPVTVVGSGGSTIEGDPNAVIAVQYAACTMTWDGTQWRIASTAVVNVGADSLTGMYVPTYRAGYWYDRRSMTNSLLALAVSGPGSALFITNTITYQPFYFHRQVTIDAMGYLGGTTAPTAGATVRLGIYTMTTAGAPGTLIGGTVSLSPTTVSTVWTAGFTGGAPPVVPQGWCFLASSLNSISLGSAYVYNGPSVSFPMPSPGVGIQTLGTTSAMAVALAPTMSFFTESGQAGALPATATPVAATVTSSFMNLLFRVAA